MWAHFLIVSPIEQRLVASPAQLDQNRVISLLIEPFVKRIFVCLVVGKMWLLILHLKKLSKLV